MPPLPVPDFESFDTTPPEVMPTGVFTVEELWSEMGAPPTGPTGKDAEAHTPLEAFRAVIYRVVRSRIKDVESRLESSGNIGAVAHLAEAVPLRAEPSGSNVILAEAKIPDTHLPFLFDRVEGAEGQSYASDDDIRTTAATQVFPVYRYQVSGRTMSLLPRTTKTITAWLIPRKAAIKEVLDDMAEEVNSHIRKVAANMLERRTKMFQQIEAETQADTPST